MNISLEFFQENLLAIIAIGITAILIYNYIVEKENTAKLSKRYRNSIFEAQSKIFLNATQYLISGDKDLAIKEFLNAVDLNRETIETYFALGGLFRSNGEIEKAISIHRSLIARENISEPTRVQALKELALDFDKGGFVDKAVETYKDLLKVNRDQQDVLQSLCRIYEDVEEWDEAYNYRVLLAKVGRESQAETIAHILVQKAKKHFERGDFHYCREELDEAFAFAPSISAKILKLKLLLVQGNIEDSKSLLFELLKEHPAYTSFVFDSLNEKFKMDDKLKDEYSTRLEILKDYFLTLDDKDLNESQSVALAKIKLLKNENRIDQANSLLKVWMVKETNISQALRVEYIKILLELNDEKEVASQAKLLVNNIYSSITRYNCKECGYQSDHIFWRCLQCKNWETINVNWKV